MAYYNPHVTNNLTGINIKGQGPVQLNDPSGHQGDMNIKNQVRQQVVMSCHYP